MTGYERLCFALCPINKDKNGRYYYAGVCPFNNAVCKLMNYLGARKAEGEEQ